MFASFWIASASLVSFAFSAFHFLIRLVSDVIDLRLVVPFLLTIKYDFFLSEIKEVRKRVYRIRGGMLEKMETYPISRGDE